MNNTSSLFENLMLMHESDKESGRKLSSKKVVKENVKKIDENDTTLLNLTVELPTDKEDIEPEDVKVDVGVMPIENEDKPAEDDVDVTPEDENEDSSEDEPTEDENEEETEEPEKEESLQLEGKDCKCTGEEDCECESCKAKKEATDIDAAKRRILARANGEDEGLIDGVSQAVGSGISGVANAVFGSKDESAKQSINEGIFKKKDKNNDKNINTKSVEVMNLKKGDSIAFGTGSNMKVKKITNIKSMGNAMGKDYIRDYVITYDDGKEERLEQNVKRNKVVKESLMHLDTTSLNKLITNFVRDNYKNIDKVVINKAILENHKLILKGFVKNNKGLKETITLVNRGFDGVKLENKRFLIDFADVGNMFNVIKESIKKPFIFTASLKNNNLKFESLKYNFKTRIDESKVAEISGNCILTESVKSMNENADQVEKFNEIVDKIKAAKSANDLTTCKDEMNKANLGDTLKSAAQMVWDDVNSKMKESTK